MRSSNEGDAERSRVGAGNVRDKAVSSLDEFRRFLHIPRQDLRCHALDRGSTSGVDRQTIVRTLIEQIAVEVIAMKRQGVTHHTAAEALNREGFRCTSGGEFTPPTVSSLCRQLCRDGVELNPVPQSPTVWTLTSLAKHLGIKPETLSTWRRRGWVDADRNGHRWLFRADATELKRLRQLAEHKRTALHKTPENFTTPKQKRAPRTIEQQQTYGGITPGSS